MNLRREEKWWCRNCTQDTTPRLRRNFLITDSWCNLKSSRYFSAAFHNVDKFHTLDINFYTDIIYMQRQNYAANFCVSECKLIATKTYFHTTLSKDDLFYRNVSFQCFPSSPRWNAPWREHLRRNIVSFDILIAFQILAANLWWNPRSVHRRAIGGNISPRYLSAEFHLQTHLSSRLPIHVVCRVRFVLSPKRLFNWSRDSFVIRRVELAGRFDAGVLLAPVSFSVSLSQLAFDTARLFDPICTEYERETACEKKRIPTRSGVNFEYGIA